jgi:hypothetical protein
MIDISLLNHATLINILLMAISGTLICPDVRTIQSPDINPTVEGIHISTLRRVLPKDTITGFFVNPFAI